MNKFFILVSVLCLAFTFLTAQTQIGLNIIGEATNDYSGHSVAISGDGNTVIIGAIKNDGNAVDDGHARVYQLNASNQWIQKGVDINSGVSSNDESGTSVAISDDGNTVAIGARYNSNSGGGGGAGRVTIYRFISGAWILKGMPIFGLNAFDYSGTSVDMTGDGNTVIIGAPSYASFSGNARVYSYSGGAWSQIGSSIAGEATGDHFGYSVSIANNGNTIAVGAYQNDGNGANAGHVRAFTFSGGNWVQKGIDIDGDAADDRMGFSVDISDDGNTLVTGATQNTSGVYQEGQVRVYNFSGGTWNQMGVEIVGESLVDWFGWSVSISGDATIIAAGSIRNDGIGNAFPDQGHVRVFEFDGSNWVIKGVEVDGDATGDWFGNSVSLSTNGLRFIAGAPNNNSYVGHAKVYEFSGCPLHYAGANKLIGTETGIADYETDGAIESIQTINPGAIIDYDSKTSIDLLHGFEVKQGGEIHIFIDGCGGSD